ncbi:MAG: hypothetical protein E7525_01335 [Ruminococcaceae bacterium]|nr:hypothetical protein [Oscillospiraceae bacterium]
MKSIKVSDFTLRSAAGNGITLSFRDKTNIARILDKIGVDAIELAPIKSIKEDTVVNRTIAGLVKNAAVKIPVGFTAESVETAFASISSANKPCLQVVVPASTVQMEYMYHLKAPAMLEKAVELVKLAKEKCERVELIACDASRADRTFLLELLKAAADYGALAVTICDDAGIMMPEEVAALVREIKEVCKACVLVETSNAISMAAANAVAAISVGADGVKTSVADNIYLNAGSFADIIRTKGVDLGVSTGLNIAGVHRDIDELLRNINVDEEDVDAAVDNAYNKVRLTKESTLADVTEATKSLGYELSVEDNGRVLEELRRVANKKLSVGSKELDAIVASVAQQVPSTYHVESYVINSGNIITATANIVLSKNGEKFCGISTGDGPINAAFLAIEQIVGHHYELDDFQIQSVTEGHEAVGSALVKLRDGGVLYSGRGISTDIVGASIRAYINALNKIVHGN